MQSHIHDITKPIFQMLHSTELRRHFYGYYFFFKMIHNYLLLILQILNKVLS